MNINRDYLIINDVKKSNITLDNGSMFFYITDKNTQNIFVNLVINISNNDLIQKYANIENAEDYTLTMNIVKPDNTYKIIEGKLHDKEKAIFEFDLKEDCVDKIGTYKCELLTKCNINDHEEITTSNKITYKVKSSVLNDLDDIVEAPEYPLVIQLFDKLSDIEQYEEDRRANELARQLAEEQRQTRFNELEADVTDSIQAIDDKVVDVENRISTKEQVVDKLIADTKADIDEYKVAKDQEIDEYKTAKDAEINNAITAQDNKIDEAIKSQNDRIAVVENNDVVQDNRLNTVEAKNQQQDGRLDAIEAKNTEQDSGLDVVENKNQQQDNRLDTAEAKNVEQDNRLEAIEAIDVAQNTRLDAIEAKNQQQDDRLLDIEKVNKRQDMNLKCLFTESKNNMIDVTEEGNSIYLQNSTTGYTLIDEIKGNTLVNCNKEPNKELILNGNINTSGDNTITITEGVDGGLVDVFLEGNTLVNVSKTKDSTAITKAYTVENSGNHIALQGDIDGSCRPVITGNTLWVDNATEEVLTAFDETKNLRLQSTFEDNLVTQEMVDSREEVADNLGKYKVEYKVTGKNKLNLPDKYNEWNGAKIAVTDGNTVAFTPASDGTQGMNYATAIIDANFKKGTQLTLSATKVSGAKYTLGNYTVGLKLIYSDGDTEIIKCPSFNQSSTVGITRVITMTLTKDVKQLGQYALAYGIQGASGDTVFKLQLEESDTATAYEPYKESTKTLYLNSPLLEGDTIEEKDDGIYHVHRSELLSYTEGDETSLITDKANTLHQLETPTYELIEQSSLAIPSYANGHLDFNTAVPVEKVDFLPFSEELTYLYTNTQYTIQFVSDRAITADITLGGTSLLSQSIVQRLNRITITTPSTLADDKLVIDGVGASISKVVVTDTSREFGYFEGMKSVGECEKLAITSANSDNTLLNTQQLTHEPLRAVGDVKDGYVLIDGKWYIERKCGYRNDYSICDAWSNENLTNRRLKLFKLDNSIEEFNDVNILRKVKSNKFKCVQYGYMDGRFNVPFLAYITENGNLWVSADINYTQRDMLNYINDCQFVYELQTPTYEPIDYNPLEVYSGTTHITTNSTIPTNITVKNHGYNCLLKPSTTYTIFSSLGLNTVTTPSTLTEDCLRFMDTDTSDVTTMRDVLILEGDWTTKANLIPSNFSGIESAFEQEYDAEKGKYKVNVKVANEDKSQENNITFYINEPLRSVGDVKDRVFIKDDKVVVQRNCGSVTLDGSDDETLTVFSTSSGKKTLLAQFVINDILLTDSAKVTQSNNFNCYSNSAWSEDRQQIYNNSQGKIGIKIRKCELRSLDINGFKQWLQQNPTTVVYQLAEPTYEEVEYNDTKLFIESFKNSTLFYNSNVPVTSTVYYSYSVPIVDTVAQTANVTDQQDSMIIDLATQCAVMEMMLM